MVPGEMTWVAESTSIDTKAAEAVVVWRNGISDWEKAFVGMTTWVRSVFLNGCIHLENFASHH